MNNRNELKRSGLKSRQAAYMRRVPGAVPLRKAVLEALEHRLCLSTTIGGVVNYATNGVGDFVASADFNGDGKRDLVVSSYSSSNLSILLGNGNGTFQSATSVSLGSAPDFVAAADVNADGKMDLVTASYDNNSVSVLMGNGNGTFAAAVSYSAGTGPRAVALGDFTGDGKLDIAVAKSFDKTLTILKNNGNGTFAAPTNANLSITPVDLVAGDFDGDGKLDLAAADFFTDKVAIMLGNGNGTFAAATTYTTGSGPASIAAADLNNDGKLDVVTANFYDNNVSVLLGNGNGTLQAATHRAAGNGATFVAAADLDGNGSADLITANTYADTISILFNNNGTFSSAVSHATGDSPRSVVIDNFNGGGLDIAVSNQGASSVSVLLNTGGSVTGPAADAGGPYTASEGGAVQLNGNASTGSGLSYVWDLDGDGVFGETGSGATRGNETGATPTFSAVGLDGPSTRTVTLRVTDGDGQTSTATATITIQNVAPTLTISGNNSVNEGSTYTLNLSKSDPGADTITKWVITWGDGAVQTVNGNPSSVTHTYADNGSYTITATATDEDGTYSSNSKTVTVNNVAPTLTISGANSVNVGASYTLNLSSSDPGADTITKWVITWGDGVVQTVNGNPSSVTHTYTGSSANYTITATATDEDGTYASNAKAVAVIGAAPLAVAGGPYSVPENGSVVLNGSGSVGNGLSYVWDLDGDGIFGETGSGATRGNETGATPTFSAAGLDGPGTRTVSLRVTDAFAQTSTTTATITITNVAPTVSISGAGSIVTGETYTLTLSASDPGPDTISQWVINWGDGTSQTVAGNVKSVTKVYAAAGSYSITATATDEDGSYATNAVAVMVSPAVTDTLAPTASIDTPANVTTPGGATYVYTITYTDNAGLDLSSLDVNDILISGPNGFSRLSHVIKVTSLGGGKWAVTYDMDAPGGTWDAADNGTYNITLRSNQVRDTAGNYAAGIRLGTFQVAILPRDTAGNTLASARSLGNIKPGVVRVAEDGVGATDRNDYYKLTLTAASTLKLKLSNLTDNADLHLLNSAGTRIAYSKNAGTSIESLSKSLKAGTYYVRVLYQGSGGTAYRLRFEAAPSVKASAPDPALSTAKDVGALGTGAIKAITDSLSPSNRTDYVKFSLSQSAKVYLKLYQLTDNADMELLDSTGQVIASSTRAGTSDEPLRLNLAAGTYYVRVTLAGSVGTSYRLRLANEV